MEQLTLKVINDITTRINSAEDVHSLLTIIMDTARQLLRAEAASLLLYDSETEELVFDVARGRGGGLLGGKRFPIGQGIAGQCARDRAPVIVNNAEEDERILRSIGDSIDFVTRKLMAVPMLARSELIGVLEVLNTVDGRDFSNRDLKVVSYLANMAALAIQNRRLTQNMADRADELQCVYEISQTLMANEDLEEGLDSVLESIERVLRVERVSIILKDDRADTVKTIRLRGFSFEDQDARIDPESGIAGVVMRSGDPLLVRDIEKELRLLPARAGRYQTKSFVSVPIKLDDRIVGLLNAADKKDGNPFDYLELKVLSTIGGQVGEMYRRSLSRKREIELKTYRKDMETAAMIQMNSLPQIPARIAGLEIATRYEASRDVGGDFYDLIYHSDDRISVVIADVAGKGVPAALFMEYSKTLLAGQVARNLDPITSLARVNEEIYNKSQMAIFVTVMLVQLEREHFRLRVGSAGHNNQVLARRQSGAVDLLSAKGPPLGIYDDVEYLENVVEYEPGDMLILYTDGITEANNPGYDEYTEERLLEVVAANQDASPADMVDIIFADVTRFRDGMEPSDDATMMAVRL